MVIFFGVKGKQFPGQKFRIHRRLVNDAAFIVKTRDIEEEPVFPRGMGCIPGTIEIFCPNGSAEIDLFMGPVGTSGRPAFR
jgi:hypothetical protein